MSFLKKLFGFGDSKSKEPVVAKTDAQKPPKEDYRLWIAESILQFVSSPAFSNDLEDFKEEHCAIFLGEEESTHQQFLIFKKYSALVEAKVKGLLENLGVSEKDFCQAAYICYKDPRYRRLMEEVFSAEDFQWFKKMMTRKNRHLEGELQQQAGRLTKAQRLEQEQKEFEYALAVSRKMHDEYLQALERDEAALRDAIAASWASHEAELRQRSKQEIPGTKGDRIGNENAADADNLGDFELKKKEAEKRKLEIGAKLNKENAEISAKILELQRMREMEEEKGPRTFTDNTNPTDKSQSSQAKEETPEERRERLQKQREALVMSRKQDRQLQLTKQPVEAPVKLILPTAEEREKLKHKQIYQELAKENVL
jgi:hypothetical protein